MEKDKKDKKKKKDVAPKKPKPKKKEEEAASRVLPSFESKFEMDGIRKLVLSTITQKAIGCVVGENITSEEPWIFVKKEKIEDNLELHEDSSEFLPIKKCILAYPEDEILIGFDRPIEEDMQEFFICSTIATKDNVLNIIETQRVEMQERLKQSVLKSPRPWDSFGSETEVDENILKNLRPLIEVELDSKYPLYSEKKKFKLRLVEDANDGYVEILPGRFPITNVYRKRVDAAVQITPPTLDNEAQTNPTYPKNAWTQYKYEYNEPKLNVASIKHLIQFMDSQADNLSETIHVNEHINLYTNDYKKMATPVIRSSVIVNRDIISFRDVLTSKGKMVSDVTLDPMVSGILAAAYTTTPFNRIFSSDCTEDPVNETTFGSHFVLIWSNTDTLKPKLYLHAYRDVNKIRFCPFKRNILVGGCTNGQIVIWDLTGRLEKVEAREILTPDEQKHKLIMRSLVTWMKNTNSINVVLPTAVSSLDHCHKSAVTHISFMLPEYEITRNGKLQKCDCGSMQFLTCGLDGRVLIWDLSKKHQAEVTTRVKKSQRLPRRPSALTMNISEFRDLNNVLIPTYKVNVKNPHTTIPYPLTTMTIQNKNFAFTIRNPETLDDCFQRTYFDYVESSAQYQFKPVFRVGDKLGNFFNCHFEGHDFDQGQKVNYESCKYTQFMLIHDGPIRVCAANTVDENIILTVGGRVFAIWDLLRPDQPIFWRKSKVRYVAGIWSNQQPADVVIARADSYFETWELMMRTKTPGRLIRMSGSSIMNLFSEGSNSLVKKRTFATTDIIGAVRIYKVPESTRPSSEEEVRYAFKIRDRIFERKAKLKKWVTDWKAIHGRETTTEVEDQDPEKEAPKEEEKTEEKAEEPEKEKEKARGSVRPSARPSSARPSARPSMRIPQDEETPKKKGDVLDKLTSGNTWFEKQEKLMYDILLEKKKLNLAEIERNKIPLQKLIEEQQHKSIKIEEILEKKEQIFDVAQKLIFKEKKIRKRKKFRVSFPQEISEIMKETYIDEYNEAIEPTLKFIKTNQHRRGFDWSEMIKQGKERRRSFAEKSNQKRRISKDKPVVSYKNIVVPRVASYSEDQAKLTVTISAIDNTCI